MAGGGVATSKEYWRSGREEPRPSATGVRASLRKVPVKCGLEGAKCREGGFGAERSLVGDVAGWRE